MSENVFDIVASYRRLIDEILEAEGEVTEEQYEQLLNNEENRDAKIDSICYYCNELKGNISILDDEIERLTLRKKSYESNIVRLKKGLELMLRVYNLRNSKTGNLSHKTTMFTVFSKDNTSVEVDESKLDKFDPFFGTTTSSYVKFTTTDSFTTEEIKGLQANGHTTIGYKPKVDKTALKLVLKAETPAETNELQFASENVSDEVIDKEIIDFAKLVTTTSITIR